MGGNIEKRGENSYILRVSSGYTGEGKRIIYKKTVQAKNKNEARKELALFISEIETGQAVYWQMIPYNPASRVRPPKDKLQMVKK